MRFLSRIFGRRVDAQPAARRVICSACCEIVAEPQIRVLPLYNEVAKRFVTTYRCESCWPTSIEQAIAQLTGTEDPDEIASAAEVFKNHSVFIHEYLRGDPPPVIKCLVLHMYELLKSGGIRLQIGQETLPITETKGSNDELFTLRATPHVAAESRLPGAP